MDDTQTPEPTTEEEWVRPWTAVVVHEWLRPTGRRDCPVCPSGTLKFDGTCDVCGAEVDGRE